MNPKRPFQNVYKKQYPKQKEIIDQTICTINKDPTIGQKKTGDLADLRVHKFKIGNQKLLIGYTYDDTVALVTLHILGTRENFYRDLKRNLPLTV